jgi:hypothetical protein
MKKVGAKLGKRPQHRINMPPGWWDRLVNYCQEKALIKVSKEIATLIGVSQRALAYAKKSNTFTEDMFDIVKGKLGYTTRDALLTILGGQPAAVKAAAPEGQSTTAPDPPQKGVVGTDPSNRVDVPDASDWLDVVEKAVLSADNVYVSVSISINGKARTSEQKEHSVKIVREDGKIVTKCPHEKDRTITGDQLKNLPPAKFEYIDELRRSMDKHHRKWERIIKLTPNRSQSKSKKAETDKELLKIVLKISYYFNGIVMFLKSIGLNLDDHYRKTRQLLETYAHQLQTEQSV